MEFVPEEEVTIEVREDSPSHYLYKIESFSKLLEHGVEKCESGEFESGGYKWKLVLYPDGNKKNDGEGHISSYLAIADPKVFPTNSEVKVIFTFFIYNQKSDNYLTFRGKPRRFHVLKTEWGFDKLVSHKVFNEPANGYLVEDNCAFGVEVFVIKTTGLDVWVSEEFSVGARKWHIRLYPQGNGSPVNHSISVFLYLVDANSSASQEKVLVHKSFTIIDQVNGKHYNKKTDPGWYTTSSAAWGLSAFLPLSDLNDPSKGFIVKDCCNLEVEVTVQAVVCDLP